MSSMNSLITSVVKAANPPGHTESLPESALPGMIEINPRDF